jgi:predicted metalloprotease with PDZ domain
MKHSTINYRVEVADLRAHLFNITLTLPQPQREQIVSLPVWIPGSYLVREFSKHLQNLRAHQGNHALVVRPLDKARWQIHCQPASNTPLSSPLPLVLQYQVFAHDASVRAAFLDATRGFFNGTSVLLRAEGHEASPCVLEVVRNEAIADMAQWSVATGAQALEIDANGFGFYEAEDYDELVDCPFEMGTFWSGTFTACGIPHRFVVAGAPTGFDGTCLLADTQTICEAQIHFWHGDKHGDKDGENSKPPFENYVFLLNAVADGYGGLEHRNSTALICKRLDLVPSLSKSSKNEGYTQLLGLISHEYFHTWNVKRLRPAEFAQYDYTQENYTQLLWFFEGFTSYYDDLFLRRTGLMDDTTYLQALAKAINNVAQTPGRMVETVAQSSFNAWIKYYRFDSNTPNATVNYYTKGALVALCLDLTLRKEKQTTLDDVMRGLWQRCMNHPISGAMTEHDLQAVLHQLGGRLFTSELAHWVHGTGELPVAELLQQHGVACKPATNPPSLAQQLGLRVKERNGMVHITHVLRGSAAEQAGFSSGDEWIAVQGAWRIHSMEDVALYQGTESTISVLVARDQRLLQLQLTIPATPVNHSISLCVSDAASAHAWLESPPFNEKELSQ